MKTLIKKMTSRTFIVVVLILIQITLIFGAILLLDDRFYFVSAVNTLISVVAMLALINNDQNPSAKLPWVILVFMVPVLGGIFYMLFGSKFAARKLKAANIKLEAETAHYLPENEHIMYQIREKDHAVASQMHYIQNTTNMPVYGNTEAHFYSPADDWFPVLIEELEKAENFIFMEYFIVQEGKFWDKILETLVDKAAKGVEVRMMFDDVGCLQTLPANYSNHLESLGVKCQVFNPIKAKFDISINNRDHRKITVVDGKTSFIGGSNLADEYINEVVHFGHWKDSILLFRGEAVWNSTVMFLQSWNLFRQTDTDYTKYKVAKEDIPVAVGSKGFAQPFGDTPYDKEYTGESAYINMVNLATDYAYITTPYFIVDNEMVTALTLAAKRGVDVRICLPHMPDKWYVHLMSQAYYPTLIKAGVKIMEYTPGFVHAKTIVADDKIAMVGTINFDYRSFYHHFECGVIIYDSPAVSEIKKDFLKTEEICIIMNIEEDEKFSPVKGLLRSILRLVAPLM